MEQSQTIIVVLTALYAVSEALSLIPSVKANGTIQLVFGWIKKAIDFFKVK